MTDRGIGIGDLIEFVVVLVVYEAVGPGLYLGVFHSEVLVSLLETGADSPVAVLSALPGVLAGRPDALAVAVALGVFAGTTAFVDEPTPGVGDLFGPDAPSGLAYPFYAIKVAVGIVAGTAFGAVVGAGLYLAVLHPAAIETVRASPGVASLLGAVAGNPDAVVGALAGGGLGLYSGATGRIWASGRRRRRRGGVGGSIGGGFDGDGGE
jgi:hypothetical protein